MSAKETINVTAVSYLSFIIREVDPIVKSVPNMDTL